MKVTIEGLEFKGMPEEIQRFISLYKPDIHQSDITVTMEDLESIRNHECRSENCIACKWGVWHNSRCLCNGCSGL